ncbi:hypothetical protein K9N68_19885 [Kovacikia minuta CCNUW1]|uniref:hypothetical protein n=1 Tax=Kovacikia minuta TaxID=2931930 RepID=UPI001CC953E2|nr:hypothetical protein [Kovacikia minuta]UBF23989.1 hypothetical protein K9N68_19885 [Kovacikia minuta CCNUW1]
MPRPTQAKCLHCSQLSVSQAQQLHGESGDDCWNPKRCHRRRSHYRHRIESNAKRRGKRSPSRRQELTVSETDKIAVPVEFPVIGLLYLYREARKDAHLHAVAVTVWRGSDKLAETEPIHCMGMTNGQVKSYLQKVLVTLKERYGITEFESPIRLEPCECPIAPCPLKAK